MSKGWQSRRRLDREGAETIAIQALGFLASEPERLARFLALTGLDIDDVRARLDSSEMLAAVLAHVSGDESLLLTFTAEMHVAPDSITPALALLQGPALE